MIISNYAAIQCVTTSTKWADDTPCPAIRCYEPGQQFSPAKLVEKSASVVASTSSSSAKPVLPKVVLPKTKTQNLKNIRINILNNNNNKIRRELGGGAACLKNAPNTAKELLTAIITHYFPGIN